jgi:hypothetical protein
MLRLTIMILISAVIIANPASAQEFALRVGIVDFHETVKTSRQAPAVISGLTESLSRYNFIKLVDRSKLDALIRELELGQSGLVNEATAAKAGRVHGLQVMITGSISGKSVTARAIHTETQKIISTASSEVPDMDKLGREIASGIELFIAREILKSLRNDNPDIDLQFRVVKRSDGTKLTYSGNNKIKIGESIEFHFKSSRSGYLSIIDIQPCGDIVLLFPNDMKPSNAVKADTEYVIPSGDDEFEITVTEPAGRDTVVVFFTEKKVDWLDMKKLAGRGFRSVPEGLKAGMARGLSVTSTKLKKAEWKTVTLEIEVEK